MEISAKNLRAHLYADPNGVGYGPTPETDVLGTTTKLNDPAGVTTTHTADQSKVWSELDRAGVWGAIARLRTMSVADVQTRYAAAFGGAQNVPADALIEAGFHAAELRADPLSETLDVNDPQFDAMAGLLKQAGILTDALIAAAKEHGRTVQSDAQATFGVATVPEELVRIALAVDPWMREEVADATGAVTLIRSLFLDGRQEEVPNA